MHLYFSWMFSLALRTDITPMWTGFNTLIFYDNSPVQKVSYLTPINLSPTNTSVVYETLLMSNKVAEECYVKYVHVTYDLQIAKVAFSIQSTEQPVFDNLFMHLGMFHAMIAYVKTIGKFIDNCGLINVMKSSGLIASGSLNGFLLGTHLNRCRRLHPIVSAGLQIVHFKTFLDKEKIIISDLIMEQINNLTNSKSTNPQIESEELLDLLERYEIYRNQTLEERHGKIAQFYAIYIYIYINLLINVENIHPGLTAELESEFIGIRRTDKPFCRIPIDLTLEQTINADALRNISSMTNSISARQRWAKSHALRTADISHVLNDVKLKAPEKVSTDLKKSVMSKNNQQISNFLTSLNKYINPFDSTLDHDKLYNITSGKNAAPEIEEFLLNVEKIGDDARKTFITECIEYPERYSLPIKRQKVQTFVNTVKKKKVAVSGRVQEKILSSLCKISATGIDVIFDRQFIPSINDTNKCISGRSEREFKILGSNQVRPSDFAKEMKNSKFKEALISFFLKHWQESDYNILGDKIININFDVLRWP
ncbi:GSCOCG00012217001-RA-CDS [Cotesia congregata]|nr:GSCOCG00012217001-RA-CDS [Cotesia congregata]